MAGFDTSSVAAEVTPPSNPLQTIEGFAQLQNTLNQNKLFQAKQIAGQYFGQATGPDGQVDPNKLVPLLQSDPRTAFAIPEILQGAASLKGQGLINQQAALGVAGTQVDQLRKTAAIYGAAGVAKGDTVGATKDAHDAIAKLVQSGAVQPDAAAAYMGSGDLTNDIKAAAISGAGGDTARQAIAPNITSVGTGQGTQFIAPNPVTQQVTKPTGNASFVQNQLSPQDLATPVDGVNSDGSKTRTLLGKYINSDSSSTGVPLPMIDAGPLSNTARAALGSAYGPQIASFEAEVGAAPQTKALIDQMRTSAGQFNTGPNAEFWQKAGELANEYGVKGFDPGNTATSASEAFTKIIPTILRQQAQMLGMNETDTGRQIAATSIPSKGLTEEGINKILGIVEGNTDALAAQGQVWAQQKAKHGEGTYGSFRMEFPQKVPPTIFQSQYMTPQDLQAMQKGWSASQKADWQNRKDLAKKQGWLPNAQ